MAMETEITGDYVVVKAGEPNVAIIGLTRGDETKSHHTEKLDAGEVLLVQFTDKTSAIKIKGKAAVYTKYGMVLAGDTRLEKGNNF